MKKKYLESRSHVMNVTSFRNISAYLINSKWKQEVHGGES